MSQILEQLQTQGPDTSMSRWMAVIFNDDVISFTEVISALMLATHCQLEEAQMEAWEAHHYGKAPVHFASKSECEVVVRKLQTIGLKTEVVPEWAEA